MHCHGCGHQLTTLARSYFFQASDPTTMVVSGVVSAVFKAVLSGSNRESFYLTDFADPRIHQVHSSMCHPSLIVQTSIEVCTWLFSFSIACCNDCHDVLAAANLKVCIQQSNLWVLVFLGELYPDIYLQCHPYSTTLTGSFLCFVYLLLPHAASLFGHLPCPVGFLVPLFYLVHFLL
jgi:hypothetical protein